MPALHGCRLTAGHCVHEGGLWSDWSTDVWVAPAYDTGATPYGIANGAQLYSWSGWVDWRDWDYDVGFVVLDRPVGALTGWHSYSWDDSCSFYIENEFHNPDIQRNIRSLTAVACTIGMAPSTIVICSETRSGSSGSYIKDKVGVAPIISTAQIGLYRPLRQAGRTPRLSMHRLPPANLETSKVRLD